MTGRAPQRQPDDAAQAQGPSGLPVNPARSKQRLIDGPIALTLLRFSLPLLTTNFLHSVSGTWGAIWVSHVLGANALTAVVNANIFMFMMMGAVTGIGLSAGVAIGQSYGAGDHAAIKRIVGTAVTFVVVLSLAVAAAGWIYAPDILDLMHMPAEARADGIVYLRLVCATMPSLFLYIVMMMMMRGSGDARTPFRFTLVWIALGLVLSPVLLTGSFGAPRLGIAGVALGNLFANLIALAALIAYTYRRKLTIALRGRDLWRLVPEPALLAMMLRRGAPSALESFIVQGAYFVLLTMVNDYGARTAAAYSAAAQLWGYVQMPAMAVATSIGAMTAINIGAGRWDRVGKIALRGCLLSASLTSVATCIVYALGDAPLRLFLPDAPETLVIARELNYLVLWGWIAVSVTSSLSAIVRANAAMLAPTIIFGVTMWLFRVPFAKAFQPWLGADAIWWSFPVGSVSSALLAYGYYRWGRWRENRLMMTPAAV